MSTSADLALAEQAVRQGARLAAADRGRACSRKRDGSLVSSADLQVERAIVDLIEAVHPDDGVFSEEHCRKTTRNGRCWLLDPIDGTTSYLRETGDWCVSIALRIGEKTELGVVFDPTRDELFGARRREGANLDGRALRVSSCAVLEDALVGTGLSPDPAMRTPQLAELTRLAGEIREIRCGGSAALNLAHVAAGRLDACIEGALQPWDYEAGELLVEEAGGRVFVTEPLAGTRIAACPELASPLGEIFTSGSWP
jgi:myo-inositol-1(or 4)-monophosphatase